jgi:hypothetical protein
MRRYAVLLAITLIAALLLPGAARRLRARAEAPAPAAIPEAILTLTLDGARVAPERGAVPKDHRVRLTVTNVGAAPVTLELAGYQDVLPAHDVPAHGRWEASFLADRPGEDFAWLLDGQPAGVLSVTGSHLVEGHR